MLTNTSLGYIIFTVTYTIRQTSAGTSGSLPAQCNFVPVVDGTATLYLVNGVQMNGVSAIDYPVTCQFILVRNLDYTSATTSIYLRASTPNGGGYVVNAQATGGGIYNTGGTAAGIYANLT